MPPQWTNYATPPGKKAFIYFVLTPSEIHLQSYFLYFKYNFGCLLYHPQLNLCYTKVVDFLSIFFPKKCVGCSRFGSYICSNCFSFIEFSRGSVCAVCSKSSLDERTHPLCRGRYAIDGVIPAVVYKGIIKRLLYQFKFKPYLFDLRATIADLFYESLIQNETFINIDKKLAFISYIPLHETKFRSRGYNQAEILARELSDYLSLPLFTVLKRVKKTISQVDKTKKERRINLRGAFEATSEKIIKGKTIFLVDDIVTSGATINEAARTLKKAGAEKVWGLAFAHGE